MMTNLFSVFDPCTGMMSMNWLSTLIFLMMFPYNFWLSPNKVMLFFNKFLYSLSMEMSMLMPYKGVTLMMLSIFMFILVNNSMGLFPYVFTSSSQLMFSLSIALPMWMSFMIYGWINNANMMFSHLVPVGTPAVLMPFMVMIETISNLIRPGSLAVRLTANMIAGHLLMSLLGNNSISMMIIFMMVFIILMMFEVAVSIIQAYVFMTLTVLYSSEV
uniref:ATP synthase F0 subunit 6 n=1 Tax=Carinata dushanensis TaxID=3040693 RepID=UPI002551EB2D|nr:ATP synthase F0 subunit 6 [Carinata dushanensis]WGC89408.1 ATP synthase F0 subunit 6 [Carinata dushanensis]